MTSFIFQKSVSSLFYYFLNGQKLRVHYIQKIGGNNMTTTAWKCFRCDLTFRKESHANLHKDLENHATIAIDHAIAA